MGKKKSYFIDPSVLLAAGIDPKTGKPIRKVLEKLSELLTSKTPLIVINGTIYLWI